MFDPAHGGDPLLFQHLFWFYSHPAVYIMVLPAMGVASEVIPCFARQRIFGYRFMAYAILGIASIGFLVWGHHMFVSGQSPAASMVFSLLSFLVAIPSAIKVFNWTATLYKGSIRFEAPMLYALGFVGLFTIGGLTGLFLASLALDVHLTDTYFVVSHFHYIMVGGSVMAYFAALHFWWPKVTGRMYADLWARIAAVLIFLGFNFTFFPQYILGVQGMPRRYHEYPPEFQVLNLFSSAGAVVLAAGYLLPFCLPGLVAGRRPRRRPEPVRRARPRMDDARRRRRRTTSTASRVPPHRVYDYDPNAPLEAPHEQHRPADAAQRTTSPARSACGSSWPARCCSSAACCWPTPTAAATGRPASPLPAARPTSCIGTLNTALLLTSSALVALAVAGGESQRRAPARACLAVGRVRAGAGLPGAQGRGVRQGVPRAPGARRVVPAAGRARRAAVLRAVFPGDRPARRAPHDRHRRPRRLRPRQPAPARPGPLPRRIEAAGLYWHFVDVVWIFLYPLLYLGGRSG